MQGKGTVNTFSGGMSSDTDMLHSDPSSYRDSMNGRLLFNDEGTYSWETENGSKIGVIISFNNDSSKTSFPLDNNKYVLLGSTGDDNINVLFWSREDESYSEIGILTVDEFGVASYKTLFNDINDPNNEFLNFRNYNQIEARFLYENDKMIRAYWVDGIKDDSNRPRVITFKYDSTIGSKYDISAYSGEDLNVFSMNSQADFKMGLIKYVKKINGNLLTGIYQYTYRLATSNGYKTPWYPLTRRVFVAGDSVNHSNWNEYEMGSSGVTSVKGNQIEIKGIDQRYDKIEVAYVFSETSSSILESKIFSKAKIDSDIMLFDNSSNSGEPLIIDEIPALFSGITGAKTLNIKDSTLYYGNIKENALTGINPESILSGLTISPKFRDMRSDEYHNTGGAFTLHPPVTHGYPRTSKTQVRLHGASGGLEDYVIDNDYVNYKGTQIDHLYAAHFRGETYRYSLVVYDKLGMEYFGLHLADFLFPNQSESEYKWSRVRDDGSVYTFNSSLSEKAWPTNNFNHTSLRSDKVLFGDVGENFTTGPQSLSDANRKVSHLRIMGLEFGGIDLSSIAHLISGFKIVRAKRDASILYQGLIMPTIGNNFDGPGIEGDAVLPLPSTHQLFADFSGGDPDIEPTTLPGDIKLQEKLSFSSEGTNDGDRFFIRPNMSVVYAPSIDFGIISYPNNQSGDKLTLIGGCWDEYTNEANAYKAKDQYMWYGKSYYSKNTWHYGEANNEVDYSTQPFPRYMSSMESIEMTSILGLRHSIEDWNGSGLYLSNGCRAQNSGGSDNRRAHGKENSIYIHHGNFSKPNTNLPPGGGAAFSPIYKSNGAFDGTIRSKNERGAVTDSLCYGMGSFICNYVRPIAEPYGGSNSASLDQTVFYGTGHFQPVNNPTFDNQGMPVDNVFNNIEVFGGDCYLDYFAFLRMYPNSQWDDAGGNGVNDDYSDGRVFPFENEYNHTMREASGAGGSSKSLTWSNVGARNWESLTLNPNPNPYASGLYSRDNPSQSVLEEFHINDVMNFEELLMFNSIKPFDFISNDKFPFRWRYTKEKVYGDPEDNWRNFQVNDFRDLNGVYGEITSSLYIFNQIYSWQSSAFGRLRASDRALIESQQGGTLTTGIGDKLDGVDYTSTEFGNQHQWSLFKSDSAAYWVDVNMRKIMRFAQDGKVSLSDIKGHHNFLQKELATFESFDSPVIGKGIHGTFDFSNNEAIFTFNRDRMLYTSVDYSIFITSKSNKGRSSSLFEVDQNQTVIIMPTGANHSIFIPVNRYESEINENTLFYISVNDDQLESVNIYNGTYPLPTSLFTAEPGIFYMVFRNSINDLWDYKIVNEEDATPIKQSLTYNEIGNFFHSFHSYAPSNYISTKSVVLSNYSDTKYAKKNSIYTHDYGEKGDWPSFSKKSYLTVSSNEAPMNSKTFDSLRINCNKDFSNYFSSLLMETESQLQIMDMTTDSRKKYLEDVLRFPLRNENQKDRMRGKHILLTFELKNNENHNVRITNLVTYYRSSNRL